MPDRDQLLRNIDEAYAARARGDKAAVAAYWTPDATYRLAGNSDLLREEVPVGPGDARLAVESLIDLFEFHAIERIHATVDGDTAAVHWRIRVSSGGGEPVDTELYDLWRFDEQGKARSLVQFTDTALLKKLLDDRFAD